MPYLFDLFAQGQPDPGPLAGWTRHRPVGGEETHRHARRTGDRTQCRPRIGIDLRDFAAARAAATESCRCHPRNEDSGRAASWWSTTMWMPRPRWRYCWRWTSTRPARRSHRPMRSPWRRPSSPTPSLLDIGLPEMNGYEVAKRLRQSSRGKQMIVVALTGYGQQEDRRRAQEAGFDAHLVKPVDFARSRPSAGAISARLSRATRVPQLTSPPASMVGCSP